MAQYVPESWKCSIQAATHFRKNEKHIRKLIRQRSRKFFALSSIDPQDLEQEALIAAMYAIDSFRSDRGKLDAYMTTVVDNALAMVAAESRALCRQPYAWHKEEFAEYDKTGKHEVKERWTRVPLSEGAEPDDLPALATPEQAAIRAEEEQNALRRRVRAEEKLENIRALMSPPAAKLFDLRRSPPRELLVTARNLVGRTVSVKTKMPHEALALFTGMSVRDVTKAMGEVRTTLRQHQLALI
jgi:RNA polymerase sigma factor (sigma-70 family)